MRNEIKEIYETGNKHGEMDIGKLENGNGTLKKHYEKQTMGNGRWEINDVTLNMGYRKWEKTMGYG